MRTLLAALTLLTSISTFAKTQCLGLENIFEFNENAPSSMVSKIRAIQLQQLQTYQDDDGSNVHRCIPSYFEFYVLVELKRPKNAQHLADNYDGYRKIVEMLSGHTPEITTIKLNESKYYAVKYHTGNNVTAMRLYVEEQGELKPAEGEPIYSDAGQINLVGNEIEVIHQDYDWQQGVTNKEFKYYQLKENKVVMVRKKEISIKH